MYHNSWGGPLEVDPSANEEDQSNRSMDLDRAALQKLEETQQSWLLGAGQQKKEESIDFGCIVCSKKLVRLICLLLLTAGFIAGVTTGVVKAVTKHHRHPPPPDNYTIALHMALNFFNAQKSGKLPHGNNISYRGDSGLRDGSDVQMDLVGGYYDAGDNIKFHFPQAYAMTLLSWSVIEYSNKYQAAGELAHVKELIRWGTNYLLKTFNASAPSVNTIIAQVGKGTGDNADDHFCWVRPEDMDYPRPTYQTGVGSELAAEMAAALAAASIVFKGESAYSHKLVHGAEILFKMARDKHGRYSASVTEAATFYNSTNYYDEYLWGGTWLYYATGNTSYLNLVTNYKIGAHAGAYKSSPFYGVLNWENKLIGAQILLSRLRMLQNPGYPYEDVLKNFHNQTGIVMCSYLPVYKMFPKTPGGLVLFNRGGPAPLQYSANAAFLATLYSDYLAAADIPGWNCGPQFYMASKLREFAKSQMDYILGKNPLHMSYVVGFGKKYPKYVHHRAASIPAHRRTACDESGYQWRDSKKPNPNVLQGALVGGPDPKDHFRDVRGNYNFTEPTLAGNAGLVAALVALSGKDDTGVDATSIFSEIPPMFPSPPPPSPPWTP